MEEPSSDNTDETMSPNSSPTSKNKSRGLHGPSLGIGAGIAIVSIISAFYTDHKKVVFFT